MSVGHEFGGLPFHQYIYSRALADRRQIFDAADREMESLADIVFVKHRNSPNCPCS